MIEKIDIVIAGANIIITPLETDGCYSYIITNGYNNREGELHNFYGSPLELVGKVIDGEITRKD